jgi:hypothetical protein
VDLNSKIRGNLVDNEYTIEADSHKVADLSKKWSRVRDTLAATDALGMTGRCSEQEVSLPFLMLFAENLSTQGGA